MIKDVVLGVVGGRGEEGHHVSIVANTQLMHKEDTADTAKVKAQIQRRRLQIDDAV